MRTSMSRQSKRELLYQVGPRYREARGDQKTAILNEFVLATGYARKYAIRLLNNPVSNSTPSAIRRPRARTYGPEVETALAIAWAASNYICAKRLIPFLPDLVRSLERHGHLDLSDALRAQLLSMSAATADRILRPYRRDSRRGISTTKAGKLLKKQVPVRTFTDWEDERPGFVEADLVAHCGTRVHGSFVCSLVLTDVATGWTECQALLCKSQWNVIQGLEKTIASLPFPLLGLDTDNGSEFLNNSLIDFCARNEITFTRGRAYKKNDQCFVEQKNGSVVRQLVGYDRYEGSQARRQLAELYRAVRHYVNIFQPSMKLRRKSRAPGGKEQRSYDRAQTPLQRLLASSILDPEMMHRLKVVRDALDPVQLLRQIQVLQDALWRHAIHPGTEATEVDASPGFEPALCFTGQRQEAPSDAQVTLARKRRSHRSKKPRKPRTWRTRPDPFEAVKDELYAWFLEEPELSGKMLLTRLQDLFPRRYPDNLLRTLQRRVAEWRSSSVVEVDSSDPLTLAAEPLRLRAVRVEPARELVGIS
ncbi:MAG: DDE-type integrase/transposase/recombinase [Vulcanimicrobiota bacterium]